VAEELTAHDAFAAHVDAELGIDPDELTNPWHAGFASAVSYTLGGLIPFLAIILAPLASRIVITYFAVFVALVLTGLMSARASGGSRFRTVMRVALGGVIAMSITYGIGNLFNVSGV
jgi:VIT1/CCC1 family predicted Fe2+/Mn2+ transporter